jgi:hypothetical protein
MPCYAKKFRRRGLARQCGLGHTAKIHQSWLMYFRSECNAGVTYALDTFQPLKACIVGLDIAEPPWISRGGRGTQVVGANQPVFRL